jgi:Leucine-rich repeat (LRR) protein
MPVAIVTSETENPKVSVKVSVVIVLISAVLYANDRIFFSFFSSRFFFISRIDALYGKPPVVNITTLNNTRITLTMSSSKKETTRTAPEAPLDAELSGKLVGDPETLDSHHAQEGEQQQEIDAASTARAPFYKTRQGQIILAVSLVVIVVIVVVAVVVPKNKANEEDSSPSSINNSSNETQVWSPGDFGPKYDQLVGMLSPLFPLNQKNIPYSKLQEDALRWLTFDDTYPPSANLTMPANQLLERFVMAVFYNATDGMQWVETKDFLQGTSICQWGEQNTTDSSIGGKNVVQLLCNNQELLETFVVDTQMTSMSGSLPTELGLLTNLKVLRLSNSDKLVGPIPTELGKLKKLKELKLQGNTLTGTIPLEITGLTFITLFDLSFNKNLTGPIPAGLKDLLNVETLWLSKWQSEVMQ